MLRSEEGIFQIIQNFQLREELVLKPSMIQTIRMLDQPTTFPLGFQRHTAFNLERMLIEKFLIWHTTSSLQFTLSSMLYNSMPSTGSWYSITCFAQGMITSCISPMRQSVEPSSLFWSFTESSQLQSLLCSSWRESIKTIVIQGTTLISIYSRK